MENAMSDCDCGCHDTSGTLWCEVCKDGHKKITSESGTLTDKHIEDMRVGMIEEVNDSGIPAVLPKKEDEFGDIYVFSEARLAKLKSQANTEYTTMCDIIKKAESALSGFAEWARNAEANEKRFVASSKAYVALLKEIEGEMIKTKF